MKRRPQVVVKAVLRSRVCGDWWSAVCTVCRDFEDTTGAPGPVYSTGFPFLMGWAQDHLKEHEAAS